MALPLAVLLHLLLSPPGAFDILFSLHIFLSAFGMYRLVRSWRLVRPAAVLASLAFSLSFAVAARLFAGHFGVHGAMAYAPLVLFLIHRTARRPRLREALLLGSVGALVLVMGHPQFLYQLGLLALAFGLFESVQSRRAGGSWPPIPCGSPAWFSTGRREAKGGTRFQWPTPTRGPCDSSCAGSAPS